MIKKGRHIFKSHMTLNYDFSGIRLQEGMMIPVNWDLSIDMIAVGKKGRSKEGIELDAGITYQKIHFWLETNLPNIIVVDVSSEDDLYLANVTSNIMLYSPGSSGDDMLVQLLHSKISTLAGQDLFVGEVHLKGSDSPIHYTFDAVDNGYSLPKTTEEYYKDGPTRDKTPWWMRNDGFCFEFVRPEDNNQTDEELFSGISDPLDEFHRIMIEVAESNMGLLREPAKIIQVEKWKPRKVE